MSTTEFLTTEKNQLTLENAYQTAEVIQAQCEDYMVHDVTNRNCYYNPSCNGLQFTCDDDTRHILPLTSHALNQLCGKMGVPVRYVQKCIEQGMPDLAAENINAWLDEYHKSLFIRGYSDRARGVLSDKYATMDAPDVIEVLSDSFSDKKWAVRGLLVNEERLHIRVVQKKMLNIQGEDLFAGVTVDSSDVGRSVLAVRFFIYKQVCKNGMCISENMGEIYTQRHVGLTKDEFRSELSENLHRVPAITGAVIEAIQDANNYDKALLDYNTFKEKKQEHFVSRIRALTRLPEDGVAKIIDTMYNNYSVSRWGFINAVTEVAQDYTLERRIELENAAGKLLFNGNLLVA